ncbi:hypothetical protein [Arthrobacter sp. C152]
MSDFEKLARDFAGAGDGILKEVSASVSKGALNVKNKIIKDFKSSRHFKGGKSINWNRDVRYNLTKTADSIEAEIGPYVDQEGFGTLVGIAIHGGSRGGGGTVPDPLIALQDEEPNFLQATDDILAKLLP